MLRTLVADKERALQKRLNNHEDKIENIMPRVSRNELSITNNKDRLSKHQDLLSKHKKQIEVLD